MISLCFFHRFSVFSLFAASDGFTDIFFIFSSATIGQRQLLAAWPHAAGSAFRFSASIRWCRRQLFVSPIAITLRRLLHFIFSVDFSLFDYDYFSRFTLSFLAFRFRQAVIAAAVMLIFASRRRAASFADFRHAPTPPPRRFRQRRRDAMPRAAIFVFDTDG